MIKHGKTVQQAKRFGVFAVNQKDTLEYATRKMIEEDISCLVVVDEGDFLVGILTRIDLLRAYIESEDWKQMRVADSMTTHVVTVSPKDLLTTVADLLLEKGIHRVVVVEEVDGRQRPVAVVSAADLVYHMNKEGTRWMRGTE